MENPPKPQYSVQGLARDSFNQGWWFGFFSGGGVVFALFYFGVLSS